MNILLSAGGTGGHIYPAVALGDACVKEGHKVFYVGTKGRMEEDIIKEKPYVFLPIKNDGLRKGVVQKTKAIWSQFGAIKQCITYLKQYKIDVVVSFGGFVTFPVCVAARLLKIPYLIHEQNSLIGKANKTVLKGSQGMIICFEEIKNQVNHRDIRLLGNPRASVMNETKLDENYIKSLGIDLDKPIIYIVMGSLGSASIFEPLAKELNQKEELGYQLVIAAGAFNYDQVMGMIDPKPEVKIFKSVDQLQLLKVSDLVVSRSGATSVAEITAAQVPCLYIPSPFVVANHQYYNALELYEAGAAVMIEEKDIVNVRLLEVIESLLNDKTKLTEMREKSKAFARVNAISDIMKWMAELK